jgi:iron(III) transport system ATP-binding protein
MNAGRIEQIGTPEEVYERPNSAFVARFIGGSNVLRVTHVAGNMVEIGGHTLEIGQGEFSGPGQPMSVCVKTHDLELVPVASAGTRGNNVLPGIVRSQAYLGSHRDYIVDVGQDVLISTRAGLEVATGSQAAVRFDAQRCRGLSR